MCQEATISKMETVEPIGEKLFVIELSLFQVCLIILFIAAVFWALDEYVD